MVIIPLPKALLKIQLYLIKFKQVLSMRTFQNTKVGDTVRVEFNTIEEGVERRQSFEGILLKVRGSGPNQSITVRRMSFGVGVERIYPVASPRFLGIKMIRGGKVRRSKLYYLRNLSGKAHRVASEEAPAVKPNASSASVSPVNSEPAEAAAAAPAQATTA